MSRNKHRNRGKKKQQQKQKQHNQKYPQPPTPLAVVTSAGLMPVKTQTNQSKTQSKKKKEKPNKVYARRIVPLSQWKRFENFMERLPMMEEALHELQENWTAHLTFLREEFGYAENDMVEIKDCIEMLFDLFSGVDKSSQRSLAERVSNRPWQKYDNMIAEILIEDISDGNL